MSQPPAYTPVGAGMPDILDAFYGFLSTYLVRYVPAENIIRGWENRYALPSGTNDYIIYTLSGSSRVGTNALSEVSADGTMTFSTLFEGTVQIDFCSDTEASRLWAAYCDSLLRSPVGLRFLVNLYRQSRQRRICGRVRPVREADHAHRPCLLYAHIHGGSGVRRARTVEPSGKCRRPPQTLEVSNAHSRIEYRQDRTARHRGGP